MRISFVVLCLLPLLSAAPASSVTLSQTTSSTILAGNSGSCSSGGSHLDNSYYRRFVMADHGISSAFSVTGVSFGIEQALAPSGSQPISVRLYTIPTGSPLMVASLTLVNQVNLSVGNQSLTNFASPNSFVLSSPATQDLVVEVFSPNGVPAGNRFLIGSNSAGETRPSYIRAPGCAINDIATFSSVGFSGIHILITVTGSQVTGVPAEAASRGLTLGAQPSPARGDRLNVRFTLAAAGSATLDLMDVSGRDVGSWAVGALGIGPHEMELGVAHRFAPGVYFVRLTQQGRSVFARVAVVD